MVLVSCCNGCMERWGDRSSQAQSSGHEPAKVTGGGKKLYERTAPLAHLVSLGVEILRL